MRLFVAAIFAFIAISADAQSVISIEASDFPEISDTLKRRHSVIIDARSSEMYRSGHIRGAVNIDINQENSQRRIRRYLDKREIVIYCTTNNRSGRFIEALKEMEYRGTIYFITDGITGWKESGYPLRVRRSILFWTNRH